MGVKESCKFGFASGRGTLRVRLVDIVGYYWGKTVRERLYGVPRGPTKGNYITQLFGSTKFLVVVRKTDQPTT